MSNLTTLPETNELHLKMDGWNTFSFPFGSLPIFRGYVSFREGNIFQMGWFNHEVAFLAPFFPDAPETVISGLEVPRQIDACRIRSWWDSTARNLSYIKMLK